MTYRLGLYEKALPSFLTWEEKLREAKRAGFDWLEISIDETDEKLRRLEWSEGQFTALRQAIAKSKCPALTMCLSGHRRFSLGSRETEKRARALEILRRAVDFSLRIGIRVIQLAGYDVYYEESCEETRRLFSENLKLCVAYAAERGVLLGFETMETPFMDTARKAMHYVKENNSPYLGIYPDIGNLTNASLLYSASVTEDLAYGAGHIFAAHLKETRPGVYRNLTYGEGHTDYVSAVSALYGMGVRMFTGEFWYKGEREWRQGLADSASFLRSQIENAIAGGCAEL